MSKKQKITLGIVTMCLPLIGIMIWVGIQSWQSLLTSLGIIFGIIICVIGGFWIMGYPIITITKEVDKDKTE